MVAPASVPAERLTDWRRASDTTETPFDAAGVTVTARILLYEDDALRERVRARTGIDRSWRFFLATRLELTPRPPVTGLLRGLVAARADRGFTDRLGERGFEAVERVERRTLRVGDDEARLFGYEARCRIDGVTLSVDGWLAVWAPDRDFRVAGGAYPTGVLDDADGGDADGGDADGGDADGGALRRLFDPSAFRSELFDLIRETG